MNNPHLNPVDLSAADAVWVATAELQRDHPDQGEFAVNEIVNKVQAERLTTRQPMTIYLHVSQHCVANRPPNKVRLRMLIETPGGKRRLFHDGDSYHPLREKARVAPKPDVLPPEFRPLLHWYDEWNRTHALPVDEADPLLALVGTGKAIWADEHADEYVNRLREGWE
jgi:hypothetical protein